jgi:acetyl esterase
MQSDPAADPDPPLDPDSAAALARIHAPGAPRFETLTPDAARAVYAAARKGAVAPPLPVAECRDLVLPGPRGGVAARLYRPEGADGAGLVYFHGGGWVLGSLDSHDGLCRRLALAAGATVISVDYALAPEAPFPAGLDDCVAALAAVRAGAAGFGIDPARLAVGGDSAGGNLAVAACLTLRDAGAPLPAVQLLLYPAVDLSMRHPSHATFAEGHFLTRAFQAWCHRHYLSAGGDVADWRVSPLAAPRLAGLPPALVLTASHDPLRDEGEAFALRLAAAGVPATLWRIPGQIHGFLPMDGLMRVVPAVVATLGRHLRAALAPA